jgi:preprotein translocase subunit SecD
LEAVSVVRNREIISLALILIVTALALWVDFAPGENWLGRDVRIRLGLDLQGGTQVLLKADGTPDREVMQTAKGVIERRVNGLGVSESVVQVSGTDRIIVELPGVSNPAQAVETLRGTGRLEFIDTQGQSLAPGTVVRTTGNPNPAALLTTPTPPALTPLPQATVAPDPNATAAPTTPPAPTAVPVQPTIDPNIPIYTSITDGADLDTNSVQLRIGGSQNLGNQFGVAFAFLGQSATQLETFSSQNIQKPMCIVLDNVIFSCPVIQAALVGGSGEITTGTRVDGERIFNQLKYGALPISFQVESSRTVSATLGQNSVTASIQAGIIGITVVALFMILFYRLPGFLAVIALLIYTAMSFAIYKLIPITLTLPGIAGFILSLGLALDANVLIFARLKEELRRGRSLRTAIEAGFDEAWPAIRDSSASTIITSAILLVFGNSFGVSLIVGFAVTLILGILLSLFTAVVVTRTLLRMIGPIQAAQNSWMYDLQDAPGLQQR